MFVIDIAGPLQLSLRPPPPAVYRKCRACPRAFKQRQGNHAGRFLLCEVCRPAPPGSRPPRGLRGGATRPCKDCGKPFTNAPGRTLQIGPCCRG